MENTPTPESPTPAPVPPPVRRPVRWKSACVIATIGALVIGYLRFVSDNSHQNRNLSTLATCIFTGFALTLWLLFFSRLPWKTRGKWFAGIVGMGVALASMFELKGFTGDMRPILRFRFAKRVELPHATVTSAPNAAEAATTSKHTGADFPQFMGPYRNTTVTNDFVPARDWQASAPQQLWRQPVGSAWSAFAIRDGIAVTQEQRGDQEAVVAYELETGKLLWLHTDKARYETKIAGEGPRATPTISGDRVFAMGATGWLNCLELATGKVVWSKNVVTEYQVKAIEWGVSGSPLVLGDEVIVSPGGGNDHSLVALRTSDGSFVWGGGSDKAGYSSPVFGQLAGREQVLIFNNGALAGHDRATGAVLWQYPWPANHPHIALPVILPDDQVLASTGYGYGSELLHITAGDNGAFTATRVWKSNRLKAKFNNFIVHEGYIYGLDDGILTCLELATGEQKWKDGRYGHGQFIFTHGLLVLMAEEGAVVLIEPSAAGLHELTRFTALSGKTWNPPALAGDLLLVRNDLEAACFRLPGMWGSGDKVTR